MFCRPGRPGHHSVTIRDNKSFHFSSNDPLSNGHCQDPFSVFCQMEHGGDVKQAVKAAVEGLGMKRERKASKHNSGGGNEEFFWYPKKVRKDEITVGILQSKISDYLWQNGFTKIYPQGEIESIFVRISNNVCSLVSPGQMKDFFMDYVRSFPDNLPEVGGHVCTKMAVIEILERGAASYFGIPQLECIPTANPQFVKDTKDAAFFFFANGFAIVTKTGTTFRIYSELTGVIWESQKLKREYRKADTQTGEFERLLFNVCGQDASRFFIL